MKKLLLATCFLSGFVFSDAQGLLPVGNTQLNTGIGFSNWGVPLYVGLDYGAAKDFTVGAEWSLRTYHDHYRGVYYGHTIFGFSGNGNYHFNSLLGIPEQFDFYAGLNLGFYAWTSDAEYPGNNNSGLGLGAQIGGRYYFRRKIGMNLEITGGNSISGGKIGVTIKL